MSDLSPRKKGQIRALLENTTLSQREIARKLLVSQSVVSKIKTKINFGDSTSPRRRGRCGRKRLTSVQTDRWLVRHSLRNRQMSSRRLAQTLLDRNIQVSPVTVRRRLFAAGLKAYRPVNKPRLTPRMKGQRLQWAQQFKDWTATDWERVIFTDESTLEILQNRSRFVRRRRGEEFLPDCVRQTVKHPDKIMIWSSISVHGTGRLYVVQGMMNAQQYQEVLHTRFVPQMMQWYPDGNAVLMHDGAPCHRSRQISQYLEQVGIEVLPWPGNSPDLNPIEGLWKMLKDKVCSSDITNRRELTERLVQIWHHDQQLQNLARQYIQSMPRRVQAVIKAKGWNTKY